MYSPWCYERENVQSRANGVMGKWCYEREMANVQSRANGIMSGKMYSPLHMLYISKS